MGDPYRRHQGSKRCQPDSTSCNMLVPPPCFTHFAIITCTCFREMHLWTNLSIENPIACVCFSTMYIDPCCFVPLSALTLFLIARPSIAIVTVAMRCLPDPKQAVPFSHALPSTLEEKSRSNLLLRSSTLSLPFALFTIIDPTKRYDVVSRSDDGRLFPSNPLPHLFNVAIRFPLVFTCLSDALSRLEEHQTSELLCLRLGFLPHRG